MGVTQQRDRTLSLALLGASLFVTASLAFGADGALAYNNATGRARWLDWMSQLVDLPSGFPSFFRGAPVGVVTRSIVTELALPALLWIFALLAGWMLFVVLGRRLQPGVMTPALLAPTCLAVIFMLGVNATWWVRSDSRLTATRAQLQLLRHFDPQYRPLGVQPFPPQLIRSDDLLARLALTTSAIDPSPAGMLLFLTEVPAGSYRLHVSHKPHGRGTLVLNIGRGSVPAARWPLRAERADTHDLYLPLTASTFSVKADEEAARAIELVKLIPTAIERNTASVFGRARDAARYGAATVYAVDDRVWLEPDGFWLMGTQPAAVVIAPDKSVSSVELRLRNIPVPNRLYVETSDWREERVLAPNETWMIRVPMMGQRANVVSFTVQNGVRPIDLDSANRDHRTLGSWVQLQDAGVAEER